MNYSASEFEEAYTYKGNDLGFFWTPSHTTFKLWAPTADSAWVRLYTSGDPWAADFLEAVPMIPSENGTWITQKYGDLNGLYYTFSVSIDGTQTEAIDPYAKAAGVNGIRGMILDLSSTNPPGWEYDHNPNPVMSICDAVIYELHIRDFSISRSSHIRGKGKFSGVIESGTKTSGGQYTGLDHLKRLGITHLHLLPFFDFGSVDESRPEKRQFNWGYDPVNYNLPEGSYSTDPRHGEVRVRELKEMILGLHQNGISVIMDVVYNHVYDAGQFSINKLVPGYFSRINNGQYSNGSYCGNDTASERSMVRKFIVDSVTYWADEYHIDGFRFDIVGLLDIDTVNEVLLSVHQKHPDVIFFGEGWSMNTTPTKPSQLATQYNSRLTPGMAYFSDTIRDALRGSPFNGASGFLTGSTSCLSSLRSCFMGLPDWCGTPEQSINYVSCHDDYTLYDWIRLITPHRTEDQHIRMNRLAAAFIFTAQGVPFMQAGEEMLRSKRKKNGAFERNSYKSADSVNSLRWNQLDRPVYQQTVKYYCGLIAFRKAHPALRMTDPEVIRRSIQIIPYADHHVETFLIQRSSVNDPARFIYVIFNASTACKTVPLPPGNWELHINDEQAGTECLQVFSGSVPVPSISASVLVQF